MAKAKTNMNLTLDYAPSFVTCGFVAASSAYIKNCKLLLWWQNN